MKRVPILSVLLSIVIIIGFLLLFPVEMVFLALLLAILSILLFYVWSFGYQNRILTGPEKSYSLAQRG